MTWRVAYSLDKLLTQLNALAPWRSKISDGAKGDDAHAARTSDHNPWFVLKGQPLVTARDFTHDPVNGLDCHWLAETLVLSRDPRIKYIIWNGKILDSRPPHVWKWMPYSGSNLHTKHLHLSVMDNASADDTRMWALTPHLPLDDDDMTPDEFFAAALFTDNPGTPQARTVRVRDFFNELRAKPTLEDVRRVVREEMAKTVSVKVTVDGE